MTALAMFICWSGSLVWCVSIWAMSYYLLSFVGSVSWMAQWIGLVKWTVLQSQLYCLPHLLAIFVLNGTTVTRRRAFIVGCAVLMGLISGFLYLDKPVLGLIYAANGLCALGIVLGLLRLLVRIHHRAVIISPRVMCVLYEIYHESLMDHS